MNNMLVLYFKIGYFYFKIGYFYFKIGYFYQFPRSKHLQFIFQVIYRAMLNIAKYYCTFDWFVAFWEHQYFLWLNWLEL